MNSSVKMVVLGGLAIAAAFTFAAPAAAEYEGPWCLQFNNGRSSSERCHFASFESCAQERILQGTTAFCRQNSRYLPYWQGRGFGAEAAVAPTMRKRKHRHH